MPLAEEPSLSRLYRCGIPAANPHFRQHSLTGAFRRQRPRGALLDSRASVASDTDGCVMAASRWSDLGRYRLLGGPVRAEKLGPVEVDHMVGIVGEPDLGLPSNVRGILAEVADSEKSRYVDTLSR